MPSNFLVKQLTNHPPDQLVAGLVGLFNPKVFFDVWAVRLDGLVKPIPYLQMCNLLLSGLILFLQCPQNPARKRLLVCLHLLPLASISALLLHQATNAGLYYIIAIVMYIWAHLDSRHVTARGMERQEDRPPA